MTSRRVTPPTEEGDLLAEAPKVVISIPDNRRNQVGVIDRPADRLDPGDVLLYLVERQVPRKRSRRRTSASSVISLLDATAASRPPRSALDQLRRRAG